LSLSFGGLFVLCAVAQAVSGATLYREQHAAGDDLLQFLQTGTFLDGMFVNWQAAILQLACLIIFGTFLFQKGATHSKKQRRSADNGHRRLSSWIYRNSLGSAFVFLFVAFFALHLVFGTHAYNEERALTGEAPVSVAYFATSAKFWFSNFQTWEAEFLAIVFYLVLSIYLRQQSSPESKPTGAANTETGEANK